MSRFEFESRTFLWFCYITFVHMENHVCLSRGVQVAGATWWAATRIVVGVRDLVQRIRDDQAQVRYSVAGQSGGRVTPCAVYTVHIETRSAGFLVEHQNQGRRVFRFGPQNQQLRFGDFGIKITAIISWFGPQNQARFGLLVVPQNRRREVGVGHTSRFNGLLRLEASQASVSQSGLKIGGCSTAGGAHNIIIEITLS
jgi:hypothetical protein